MADGSNAPPPTDPWSQGGREYWDAWLGLWQQGVRAAAPEAAQPKQREPEWGRFFEDWWRTATRGAPPSSADLLQRLADQGRAFLAMAEEYTATAMRSGNALSTPADWERVLRSASEGWQRALGLSPADPAGLSTFWKLPLDTWSRTASSASVFPGDYLENLKPEGWSRLSDDVHRNLDRFLSTPGVGYTREWQAQGQELGRLTLEYQRALQEYLGLFRQLNLEIVNRVYRALGERSERQQPITTLRGVYDLWVDCSEAAYLELVSTDDYAKAYGHMVNTLMALKQHGRHLVDEAVGAMGMPTSRSLATLQQRQQELRRELSALRSQQAGARVDRQEFDALRAELDQLRSELRARAAAARPVSEPTQNGPAPAEATPPQPGPGSAKRPGRRPPKPGRSAPKRKGG
jgi:polyhydroxyalkanoate synthase subunit PhaE